MEKTYIKTLSTSRYFDRLRNVPFVAIKTFGPENQRKEKLSLIPSFAIPLVDSGTGEQAQFLVRFDEILDGFDKLDQKVGRRLLRDWVGALLESANGIADGPKYELQVGARMDLVSFLTSDYSDRNSDDRELDRLVHQMFKRIGELYEMQPQLTVTMKPTTKRELGSVNARFDNLSVEAQLGFGVRLTVWREPEFVDLDVVAHNVLRESRLGGTVMLGSVQHRFAVAHDFFKEDVIGDYVTHGAVEEAFATLWNSYTLLNGHLPGDVPMLKFFK